MILTPQTLQEHLEKIGYKIKFGYPLRTIHNHKDEDTNIFLTSEILFIENDKGIKVTFIFGKAEILQRDKQTITIKSEGCFMNLYNFD